MGRSGSGVGSGSGCAEGSSMTFASASGAGSSEGVDETQTFLTHVESSGQSLVCVHSPGGVGHANKRALDKHSKKQRITARMDISYIPV